MVDTDISRILISEKEIQSLVDGLGKKITAHYKDTGGDLVVVGLLRGAFVFMSDLVRKIDYPLVVDFLAVSSYGDGTVSSGDVRIMMDLDGAIEGKHVLLVEDVVDTGNTFSKVINMLKKRSPKSLKVCTLLNKPARRKVEVHIDFCGTDIPDEFVCGYGLDYAQKYRNLPYIGVLDI